MILSLPIDTVDSMVIQGPSSNQQQNVYRQTEEKDETQSIS